ncbi:hypothetical protein BofuT4_uP140940.1 [Botrytis cinerea T4]|uniref:Uncharacterized protein n=1 Tax=Botryotinia fuckeliana (strain T4) TaxID=999810 RepID=G2YYY4_BOTF4|nr:hypothetical protein BofuT4_uP140940.1 [Botrytis cinerea T4]
MEYRAEETIAQANAWCSMTRNIEKLVAEVKSKLNLRNWPSLNESIATNI